MCGIFGVKVKSDSTIVDQLRVKESAMLMRHRGPDAYEQWGIFKNIELAHLRLSIIDLSRESNQPFFSNCKNYVIVFNGEIYNYIEIKSELQALGYLFRTSSDTEVLLNAYIEWGDQCVLKFNGDWAFAIYHIPDDVLFCSRDRFGVKPFNYAIVDDQFVFSSEIKSILNYLPELRQPNYNVISNYCRNSLGAQGKETWFGGINRLLPAHNLTWKNGQIQIERYWDYPKKTVGNIPFDEAVRTYQDLFLNAVKIRMRSDVPVGTTLSSGLDSGSIVSVMRRFHEGIPKTFTAVFNQGEFRPLEKTVYRRDAEINEVDPVERLARELSLEAHLIDVQNNNFIDDLSFLIYHLESGHSSPATIPLSKILEYAKKHVTVIMEGQGADELLSGYTLNTFPILLFENFKRGNMIQLIKEFVEFNKSYSIAYCLKQFIRLLNADTIERLFSLASGRERVFGPKLKKYVRIKDYPLEPEGFNERFNGELFKSHTGGLVNLLHYGDAISMSKSLESRLPFMDVHLVEFSFTLPFNFKMKNGLGKYIHRVSMDNIVPDFILKNPIKLGFNTPLSKCFDSSDREGNRILLSQKCLDRGIFDREGLQDFIDEHIAGKKNNSTMLFRLLSVELWFRRFID
jgi:asparagine synthase (glutamine-hydrolysing)